MPLPIPPEMPKKPAGAKPEAVERRTEEKVRKPRPTESVPQERPRGPQEGAPRRPRPEQAPPQKAAAGSKQRPIRNRPPEEREEQERPRRRPSPGNTSETPPRKRPAPNGARPAAPKKKPVLVEDEVDPTAPRVEKMAEEWAVDPRTGKKYRKLPETDWTSVKDRGRSGFMSVSHLSDDDMLSAFDGTSMDMAAGQFLAHLRVAPDKQEQERIRKEKALLKKQQEELYRAQLEAQAAEEKDAFEYDDDDE